MYSRLEQPQIQSLTIYWLLFLCLWNKASLQQIILGRKVGKNSLVHVEATLPALLKTIAMKYNIFAAKVLWMTPHDRLRAITLIPRLSEAKEQRGEWGLGCSAMWVFSVWTFRKVEEINLDPMCGWQMGQKHRQIVYHTEKGILEMIAVCDLVSSSVKQTHNSTMDGEHLQGLNEKENIKHLAQGLACSGCSINVSFYFRYS